MTLIKEWVTLDVTKEEEDLWHGEGASLGIFDGSDATLDGVIINALLARIPLMKELGIRYWAIMDPVTDGLDGIHIGTLRGAKNKAQGILFKRYNIIDGKATQVGDSNRVLASKL